MLPPLFRERNGKKPKKRATLYLENSIRGDPGFREG
jgi:hypothetical protein